MDQKIMMQQNQQIPDQVMSPDFEQRFITTIGTRVPGDHMVMFFGHEEMRNLNPPKTNIVLDGELVLTFDKAKALADQIYGHLEKLKLIPEK